MSRGDYARLILYFFAAYVVLRFSVGILLESPTAALISALLGCPSQGNKIVCGQYAYVIVPECTGIVSVALLFAVLLALRFPPRRLFRPLVMGSLFLYLLDVLRVYSLIRFTGSIASFDFFHMLSWFLSPVVVVLYALWLAK